MRRLLITFIFSTFVLIGYGQESSWSTMKSTEMAFRIDFPQKAKAKSQDVPTAKGDVVMNSFEASSVNDKNFFYMASFSQYPTSFFPDGVDTFQKQTKMLDGSVNGAVENTKGTLVQDKKIVFNGYNGRRVKIEVPAGDDAYVLSMMIVLVNYKLYISQVISNKGSEENEDTTRFFDSFELINVKE